MPSFLHEGIVRLLSDRPELAVTLLRDLLGIDVPEYGEVRLESADLGDLAPAARHADVVVVLLVDETPVLAIVVEVQLAIDPDKRFTWPVYLVNLRDRVRCPVELLVLTPDRAVAGWAAHDIPIGQGYLRPLVLGPDGLPIVREPEAAIARPELAVLSAMAHGHDGAEIAIPSALAALAAAAGFDDARALLYSDLVLTALDDAARIALEALMQDKPYEIQSDFIRRYFDEGKAEGKADIVLKLVQLKFGAPADELRARITGASSETLDRWAERVLTATSIDEVFVEG